MPVTNVCQSCLHGRSDDAAQNYRRRDNFLFDFCAGFAVGPTGEIAQTPIV